jgi:branched-chain amino acid transport system substrate-binding protein
LRLSGINRRRFLGTSAMSGAAAAAAPLRSRSAGAGDNEVVKIGLLLPLTGDVAAWGLPGLYGCQMWAQHQNAAGGVEIGGATYDIEIVSVDDQYRRDQAGIGAYRLIHEEGVQFIVMLGGDTWAGAQPMIDDAGMLASTLIPTDLSPDTVNLVAPCEVHPIYNLTGVWWLADTMTQASSAAICAQSDAIGRPSMATYLAAFEVAGIAVDEAIYFDAVTTDFAPVVAAMLAGDPDILCFDTAYPDFVNELCRQAYLQGFDGQIISCTADHYQDIIANTSEAFMEGTVFQFPDFDDPAMNDPRINFRDPNRFYADYVARYPGQWGAVSWEYASILDLWVHGARKAGSIKPQDVLAGMKEGGKAPHAFGEASWWGRELFGIDNALVGNWPVVQIQNGKAVITDFRNIPEWWDLHSETLIRNLEDQGEMWYQRD